MKSEVNDVKNEEYSEVVEISRIRRVTGYLVGDYTSFNNAKQAELKDRTKHTGRVGYKADADI